MIRYKNDKESFYVNNPTNEPENIEAINFYNDEIQSLNIMNNISSYVNLQNISLIDCHISYIPDFFYNLTKIKNINLNKNNIKYISTNIKNLKNLDSLYLSSNYLEYLPEEIGYCHNIKNLCISNNNLKELPKSIGNLKKLEFFYIDGNDLISFPSEIINCDKLLYILFLPQNKCFKLHTHILRFINRYSSSVKNDYIIYNNKENIHTSSIQESFKKSLINLMNDKIDKEIIFINYIDTSLKQFVIDCINDKTLITSVYLTYEDVFKHVLNRIINSTNKNQLLKRVHEEIKESVNLCFIGKVTRLVNSLSGFFDDIYIGISENEQIENIIISSLKKNNPRKWFQDEMYERGYSNDVISNYLKYIDDYLEN